MLIIKLLLTYVALQYLTNNFWLSVISGLGLVALDTLIAEMWDNTKFNVLIYGFNELGRRLKFIWMEKHDNKQ